MATEIKKSGKEKEIKKYTFSWSYKNPNNNGAISTGEMEAASINVVKASLRRAGMQDRYLTIKKEKEGGFGQTIKMSDILVFLRQLATLQNAGVSSMESLEMLLLTSKKRPMKNMIKRMIKHLNEGNQLSDALKLFPKWFDHISISLIRAGEQGGVLDTVLRDIADFQEKDYSIKKKIKSALMYPAVTVLVMIVVVIIMMVKVIPVFAHLYKSFGSQLPYLTQVVVNLSDWLKSNVSLLILVPAVVIAKWIRFLMCLAIRSSMPVLPKPPRTSSRVAPLRMDSRNRLCLCCRYRCFLLEKSLVTSRSWRKKRESSMKEKWMKW